MNNKGLRRILIVVILITSISLTTFFWVLSSGSFAPEDEDQKAYFISQAWIFDGDTVLDGRQNVRIVAGEIVCVSDTCQARPGDIQVAARDKTLMPGLIDHYVQFYAPGIETRDQSGWAGLMDFTQQRPAIRRNLIRAGISSMRSIGDVPDNIYLLDNQIVRAKMAGPRIFPAGPFITAPNGHPVSTRYADNQPLIQQGTRQPDSPAAADDLVKELYGAGMLGIQIVYDERQGEVPKLDSQVVKALIAAADSRGMWTAVQASEAADILDLARWGARTIFFNGTLPNPLQLAALAGTGLTLVPTTAYDQTEFAPLPYSILDSMGIWVGIGSGQHHSSHRFGEAYHRALQAQIAGQRAPIQILRAATLQAAQSLKADEKIGTVRLEREADLLLVPGQPWLDARLLAKPEWVMVQGRVLLRKGQIVE